jgi:ribonuclease VapC
MIAVDTSAIVALALLEPEARAFSEIIGANGGLTGTPTLLETRLVLASRIPEAHANSFLDDFIARPSVHPVAFTLEMYRAAADAFDRFGRGRHPAKLNLGDCMAYAVARTHDAPLLYKGGDFARTDIQSAFP